MDNTNSTTPDAEVARADLAAEAPLDPLKELEAPAPKAAAHPTFEAHAKAKNTPAWLVAAAKAYRLLPEGKELSEKDFDELVAEVAGLPCGYDIAKAKAKPKEPAK